MKNKKFRSFHKLGPCKRSKNVTVRDNAFREKSNLNTTVRLAAAVCGNRLNEAVTMLKSAILFAKEVELFVEIFQDEVTAPQLPEKVIRKEDLL